MRGFAKLLVGVALVLGLAGACGCASAEKPTPEPAPGGSTPSEPAPFPSNPTPDSAPSASTSSDSVDLASIPAYAGEPFVELDGNRPSFADAELSLEPREGYAPLDDLGRCGPAFALVGPETLPEEPRGSIGGVRPSGWHLVKYDIVDGKYLFNRCHLIAYRLTGQNDNPSNLITGTRHLNAQGMLPFENEVGDYVERTGNHVLMRVTPVFEGDELVARGVQLEARSVEDGGAGVSFNVYAYNVQPGVAIDYVTGESRLDGTLDAPDDFDASQYDYVFNTNTKRFHEPDCPSVEDMKAANREGFDGSRDEALAQGYKPCGRCAP